MTTEELKATVDRVIHVMLRRLGISRWRVEVLFERLEDRTLGCVTISERYEHTLIKIDPVQIDDEELALQVLRHELLHVVLGESDVLRTTLDLAGESNQLFHHVSERNVLALERALDLLGWTPAALASPLMEEPIARRNGRRIELELPADGPDHPRAVLAINATTTKHAASIHERLTQSLRWCRREPEEAGQQP